jgi:hypothetical protein
MGGSFLPPQESRSGECVTDIVSLKIPPRYRKLSAAGQTCHVTTGGRTGGRAALSVHCPPFSLWHHMETCLFQKKEKVRTTKLT